MTDTEIQILTERMLDACRGIVFVDPTIRILVQPTPMGFPALIAKDPGSPLTWILKISPAHNQTMSDIKQSVSDTLAHISLNELDFVDHPSITEARSRICCRISLMLNALLPDFTQEDLLSE